LEYISVKANYNKIENVKGLFLETPIGEESHMLDHQPMDLDLNFLQSIVE
jgi:hypothetical protein